MDLVEIMQDIELVRLAESVTLPVAVGGGIGVFNAIRNIKHDSRSEPRQKGFSFMDGLGKYYLPVIFGWASTNKEGSDVSNIGETTAFALTIRTAYEVATRVTEGIVYYCYRNRSSD
ncbi:hypothetical protein CMO94_02355 [Candidatus Woesearchaeota archaeon]|jgi:hypothetical protein|nr:hypothetical protein [Candidatus Woesearchaeota archaeon]|tara:strand:+ start:517 stop:867 length:351 start_codon:yes stop_codon:yes gene_type:complete